MRIKDIRARESMIMNFLLENSDIIIIVIDKFTALEKWIIEKIRKKLEIE